MNVQWTLRRLVNIGNYENVTVEIVLTELDVPKEAYEETLAELQGKAEKAISAKVREIKNR